MDLVAPGMTSRIPIFAQVAFESTHAFQLNVEPFCYNQTLPGLLLMCFAWTSDLLRICQLFL